MRRLFSSLVVTGLVVAAATTSELVIAQVAPPAAPAAKKAIVPAEGPKEGVVAKKGVVKGMDAPQKEGARAKEALVNRAIEARKRRVAARNANAKANLNP